MFGKPLKRVNRNYIYQPSISLSRVVRRPYKVILLRMDGGIAHFINRSTGVYCRLPIGDFEMVFKSIC